MLIRLLEAFVWRSQGAFKISLFLLLFFFALALEFGDLG
jgi:hypothetical protein